jgi:[acyl-carrier-protein] S-malonyltransferase
VHWEDGIRNLAAAGADRYLEAGPGDVLTKLMKRIDPALAAVPIGSPDAAEASFDV